ncbi:MAG: DNA cytosine methyltransferase [Bacteroidales bacterium]|jgi:DNA (cytosine-5)-methyltransferase 1|nr:DNA cytosine methyltransferase [Bacteroidales bacterium]MCK9498787.1 DNA cytosine methyltransferase [Bacteroidales bacterium]MDY0315155.1 DNA cytosine methyltransferase [Bacteroidales bacterium]NLB86566.1 DNA cytosine methyltransferase [Bacteroidales bacterium]
MSKDEKKYGKISIEEFDNKTFKIEFFEAENTAFITHYLQNYKNEAKKHYEKKAIKSFENLLKYKKEKEQIHILAEEAMQMLLFEVKNVAFPTPKKYTFNFIDLFAGVGGFRLALQNIGGKCIFTSEYDTNAQKTYRSNFGEVPFGDITKDSVKNFIPPTNFDILCAGFPCQAFSIAGYQKGFNDSRGNLFFDIEKIVKKHKPNVLILENVKNFLSHDKGNTFKIIQNILENKLGYKVFYKVLNSMTHANIPQNRERIFIIAFEPSKVKNYKKFTFPSEITLTNTIHDILEKNKQDDKYYYKKEHPYYLELKKSVTNKDTVYQWRRVYVRENKNNVCPTLTANMGTGGHNVPIIKDDFGIRKLTPRECFSFQGFPKNYILPNIADSKLYMQAGNSVTVPLIQRIAEQILKVL